MRYLIGFVGVIVWVFGWVLSVGFWQTFFAVIVPPYSVYIVLEHFGKMFGLV